MCAHEIVAKKGFRKGLFQPMHMARICVTGSLAGWIESPSDTIDKIIGYDTENVAQPREGDCPIILASSLGLEDYSEGLEGNPDDNLFTNRPGAVPIGYIAPSVAKLKPFSVKEMNPIWDGMTAGYAGYSDRCQ